MGRKGKEAIKKIIKKKINYNNLLKQCDQEELDAFISLLTEIKYKNGIYRIDHTPIPMNNIKNKIDSMNEDDMIYLLQDPNFLKRPPNVQIAIIFNLRK